jgi:hypothetical protein
VIGGPLGSGAATSSTTVYAADTFTRADSAASLGTSSGGGAWTAQLGTWGIATNKGYCPTPAGGAGAFNVATLPAATSDGVLTANVTFPVGATVVEAGLLLRYQDINNFVMLYLKVGVTHMYVRSGPSTFTQIDSAETTNNNPVLAASSVIPVQVTARGSAIWAVVGGTIIGGTMPPTLSAADGCGLVVVNNVDAAGVRFTNLTYQSQ